MLNHLGIQPPNQIHNQTDVNGIHHTHYIQASSQEAFFDCQNTFTIRCWEVENIHGGGVQLPTQTLTYRGISNPFSFSIPFKSYQTHVILVRYNGQPNILHHIRIFTLTIIQLIPQ